MMILMMRMTKCSGEWCCWGQSEGRERVNSNNSQWRCTFDHDGVDLDNGGADDDVSVNDDDIG